MLIPSSEIQLNKGIGYAADTGVVNVYVATVSPPIFSLTTGIEITVKISATNTSVVPTLNVNGLGAKIIIRNDTGGTLNTGDLQTGATHKFIYDGTNWRLINSYIVASTITTAGAALATDISTSSVSYVSTGFSISLTVGISGIAIIIATVGCSNGTPGASSFIRLNRDAGTAYYQLGGKSAVVTGAGDQFFGGTWKITGLSAGAHTFLLEWRVNGGTTSCRPVTVPESEQMHITGWSF